MPSPSPHVRERGLGLGLGLALNGSGDETIAGHAGPTHLQIVGRACEIRVLILQKWTLLALTALQLDK